MGFYDYMLYYIKDSGKCNCKDRTKKCYVYAAASVRLELEKIGAGEVTFEGLSDTMLNKVFNEMAQDIRQSTARRNRRYVLYGIII